MSSRAVCSALFAVVLSSAGASLRAYDCDGLARISLPAVSAVTAQNVNAGDFAPPYGDTLHKLPAFCRFAAVIRPSDDSYIRFEVWMPQSGWNGRLLAAGNGGFAGSIDYGALGRNIGHGYATAATDTGHEGAAVDASWAFHHPEKVIDFGYRALHLTIENANSVIRAFYGKTPDHSYFDACSDGGREALMEAQRYPEDFDGILAGAPANFWTHLLGAGLAGVGEMLENPVSYVSSTKLPAIQAAALAACDSDDGLKDGIIGDPSNCRFDASVLQCTGVETRRCLTAPQVSALKKLYRGAADDHGKQLFPGLVPGAEDGANGWTNWVTGQGPGISSGMGFAENYFRYIVYEDPKWNSLTARTDESVRAADEKTAQALNATDPDLSRFQARGGKLILYHGWNDPAISPWNTIDYFKSVQNKMGSQMVAKFVRVYMIPGMQHCVGGPGASFFGQLGTSTTEGHSIYLALEHWVEQGAEPENIIGTKYVDDTSSKGVRFTRPLCDYPKVPIYKGTGDPNDQANFACEPGKAN